MLEAGKRRLTALANLAPMLPIAEDLRFDASQKKIIEALGIPGVNIFVLMNRALPLSNLSIFGKDFNLMTITKLSNHDLPPIRTWWKDNPPLAWALASKMDWKYHVELNSQEQLQLLWWQMHSSSLLHIEFLQDILPLNIGGNSNDLRINFPGTNNERDWSYRFPLTVEELVSSKIVEDMIGGMLKSKGTPSIKEMASLE